jgi:hypothetical protein
LLNIITHRPAATKPHKRKHNLHYCQVASSARSQQKIFTCWQASDVWMLLWLWLSVWFLFCVKGVTHHLP